MTKTGQYLKVEVKSIKITQTERKLQVKNLGIWTGTTERSLINRKQVIEERSTDIEGTIEETDPLVKENVTYKKKLQGNCHTMGRPNQRIIE